MTTTGLNVLDRAVQKTNLWLKDLQVILGWEDRRRTFEALQAVLHTLRDRMTPDEAFQLGTQLPMLLRGFYFEAWDPDQGPTKERTKEAFLERIGQKVRHAPPESVTRGVFALLALRVTEGEIEDIRGRLPQPIRELWPKARPVSRQATLGGTPPAPARGIPVRAGDRRRARARKARKEIRSSIARARAEGVRQQDLPVLMSRRDLRKLERRKARRRGES